MDTFLSDDQLDISEHHRAALITTLDLMESDKIKHVTDGHDPLGTGSERKFTGNFNMDVWIGHGDCGTVACIGGTAELVGNVKFDDVLPDALDELFFRWGGDDPSVAQAAQALRNYLTHGHADWVGVMQS
jgi:hypothetical protein